MLWPALRALIDSGGFVPNERYRQTLIERMRTLLVALDGGDAPAAAAVVATLDPEFATRLGELYPQRISRTVPGPTSHRRNDLPCSGLTENGAFAPKNG